MDFFEIVGDAFPIHVIDIGAMDTGEDAPYASLFRDGKASVLGFEPVVEECDKLNRLHDSTNRSIRYEPYAIGDGTKRMFYITNTNMTSSLYAPDLNLMGYFNNLAELCLVTDMDRIETRRLDDIAQAHGADYLKMDIQGAEYDVLQHAEHVLDTVLAIHTEVEFVPLYQGQKLFSDIDTLMREKGFLFHRFHTISGRGFKPIIANNDINSIASQWLWADAIYVRDFTRLDRLDVRQLLKLAVILHEMYRSRDFCHLVLKAVDARQGSNMAGLYQKHMLGL